ncbi:transporter substrate-binding domain-containing protein [Granulosicoccus antarcticus]|nr:transporter substrate-binding domain-containing protein [Granulosicoccus antarcticus]
MEPITFRAIAAMVILVAATLWVTNARSDSEATLKIGWTLAPPVFEIGSNGEYTGYSVEFARLLGKQIGRNVQIQIFDNITALVDAQISGETDMLAGAPDLAIFNQSNVFSQSVGTSRYALFGLSSRLDDLDTSLDGSLRVSVLPGRPTGVDEYLKHQIEVPISSPGEGLLALLAQDIDAVIFPEDSVQTWTYRAGLDHLILPISEPVAEVQRVVALHNSHADLLPSINTAINRMEADGSLPELRRRYLMEHFEPEPEVLKVGIPQIVEGLEFAPYFLLEEDEEYTGFAIELFQKLAERAGLNYRFEVISFADMTQGPNASGVDLIPLFALPTDSRGLADHTLPTEELLVTATVRRNEREETLSLGDISGHKVGVLGGTFGHRMALKDKTLDVITFEPGDYLLDALLDRSIDVVLKTKGYTSASAERRELSAEILELTPELYRSERGILLRFGLGKVRERLNTAIGSYLLSDDYATLRQKYFGAPVFWTAGRQRIAIAGLLAAAMLILAFGSALIMSDRARRRAKAAHGEAKLAHDEAERARREAETLRNHAEDRTAETLNATSQLRAVMDAAQSGILGMNRNGEIVFANPVAREMIGIDDSSTPINWPSDVLFFNAGQTQALVGVENPVNRALSKDHQAVGVFLMSGAATEEMRSVRLASTSLPRKASPEIGTVLVIEDVTEHERDRSRVEHYDRLSMVGQLTGGVAHDFNNLLAVILSRQELLRDNISNEVHLEHIDASIGAASRGADLTRSMLAFARKAPLQPRRVDVNEMVRETRDWTVRTIATNISVETTLTEELWPIEVDVGATESALLNLILNARDAMPDGGTLTITTTGVDITESTSDYPDTIQTGPYVVLSVTDTGHGIAAENLSRIFEPFFTTKAPGQGSGLGLSMIQGFMEQSKGGAAVTSETGKGTTFELFFPASTTAVDAEPKYSVGKALEPTGQRILLVEDTAEVLDVLEAMLSSAGYAVTTADTADQALIIIESNQDFDLLLTDVMMPGRMNGVDLATILRKRCPELPVITMSGYSDFCVADEMVGGGNLQLSKPVSRSDLLCAISEALEGSLTVPG